MINLSSSVSDRSLKAAAAQLIQQKMPLIPPASIRIPTPTKPLLHANSAPQVKKSSRPPPPPPPSRKPLPVPHSLKQQQHSVAPTSRAEVPLQPSAKMGQQNPFGSEEVWTSVQDLFWDHMKEVQNKWNTLKLNDDIWAKLIYFEQNRRLAKAYVSAPVLTVDGSTHGLDGFRIGLSGIDNTYRNLDSMGCLRSIGQGIKLKIDHHGNILIRKIGNSGHHNPHHHHLNGSQCSVWVKDWPGSVGGGGSSNKGVSGDGGQWSENCMMREIEHSDVAYKLFDMRSFRAHLEQRRLNNENIMDWRQCVSIISFVRSTRDEKHPDSLLEDPCWIMLINIIAIDMIKSSLILSDEDSTISRLNGCFSSLVQNPTLFETGNSRLAAGNRSLLGNGNTKTPYRTNSSSSILFPQSDQGGFAQRASSGTDSASNNNLLLVSSDRVKKLRTSNNNRSNRGASMKSNGSNYPRRYRSIQQLSSATTSPSNSTIYTTFNGKLANNGMRSNLKPSPANHAHASTADSSSTSDYNSGSRGGQNYWRKQSYNQISYPLNSFNQRLNSSSNNNNYKLQRDEGRVIFSRKSLLPSIESSNKSLSSLDLSHRGFELRSMHSSIRMNYDYLTENEDNALDYEDDVEEVDENNIEPLKPPVLCMNHHGESLRGAAASATTSGNKLEEDQSPYAAPTISGSLIRPIRPMGSLTASSHLGKLVPPMASDTTSSDHLASSCCCVATLDAHLKDSPASRNECPAHEQAPKTTTSGIQEQQGLIGDQTGSAQKPQVSSANSSSSSSGCADNDYFMSHSSSSMSSSTASNERELFSQPNSSSGIVCSAGSTSDEYDVEGKKQTGKALIEADKGSDHLSTTTTAATTTQTTTAASTTTTTTTTTAQLSSMPELDKLILSTPTGGTAANGVVGEPHQPRDTNEVKTPNEPRKLKQKKTIVSPASKSTNRRAFHKKTIESPVYCCDQLHSQLANGLDHHLMTSKCLPVDYACTSCCCECYIQQQSPKTISDPRNEREFFEEPIYNTNLQPILRSSPVGNASGTSNGPKTKKRIEFERPKKIAQGARISSLSKINDSGNNSGEVFTAPMQQEQQNHDQSTMIMGTSKETQKQTGGWLERRGYSRIFPKFMFPSSSNNNNNNSSNSNNNRPLDAQNKEKGRPKKNGLTMVRLTRSTQDLS